jgi:hypothetical protein
MSYTREELETFAAEKEVAHEVTSPVNSALARTGIIALVDEATGYQYERSQDALVNLFAGHIDESFAPWYARIPVQFWKNLFRIIGAKLDPEELRVRASEIIDFLHEIVVLALPLDVREELLNNIPKEENHELVQMCKQCGLEELVDTGNEAFDRQVVQVGALLRAAQNKEEFDEMFKKVFKQ